MSADNTVAILKTSGPNGPLEYRLKVIHVVWNDEFELITRNPQKIREFCFRFKDCKVYTDSDEVDEEVERILDGPHYVEYDDSIYDLTQKKIAFADIVK